MNPNEQNQGNELAEIAKHRAKQAVKKKGKKIAKKIMKKAAKVAVEAIKKAVAMLVKALVGFLGSIGFPTIGTILGVIAVAVIAWILFTQVWTFGFFGSGDGKISDASEKDKEIHSQIQEEIETTYSDATEKKYSVPAALISSILQVAHESEDMKDLSDSEIISGVVDEVKSDFTYKTLEQKIEWKKKTCSKEKETTSEDSDSDSKSDSTKNDDTENDSAQNEDYDIECSKDSDIEDLGEVSFLVKVDAWNQKVEYNLTGPSWQDWKTTSKPYGGYYKRRYKLYSVSEASVETDFTKLNTYLDSIGFKTLDKEMVEGLYETTTNEEMGYSEWMISNGIKTNDGSNRSGELIDDLPEISEGTFTAPAEGYITSRFRPPHRPKHHGVDIGSGGKHVPIVSVADGVTRKSYYSPSYGHVVYIVHQINGQQYETVYAHMTKREIGVSKKVKKGQLIGYMGNTGHSKGIHLHFEMHKTNWVYNKQNAIDPLLMGVPIGR